MTITIEPIKIKQSTYLLVPKNIADMIDVENKTTFQLKVTQNKENAILEYQIQ